MFRSHSCNYFSNPQTMDRNIARGSPTSCPRSRPLATSWASSCRKTRSTRRSSPWSTKRSRRRTKDGLSVRGPPPISTRPSLHKVWYIPFYNVVVVVVVVAVVVCECMIINIGKTGTIFNFAASCRKSVRVAGTRERLFDRGCWQQKKRRNNNNKEVLTSQWHDICTGKNADVNKANV